jgi:cytochrome c-type biogenesis protein CcmH
LRRPAIAHPEVKYIRMVWIVVALMTAAAVFAVLWPLTRRPRDARGGSDVEVYRDQLDEIERDQKWGLIAAREAEAARLEVSRRLISAADAAPETKPEGATSLRRRRLVGATALAAIPIGALSLYLVLGSPDLPGQPLATRAASAHGGDDSMAQLFARVEAHLEQNPDDGRGWEVVAPIYMRLGRYQDAVKAREAALRLLGPTAERESDFGEALIALENGVVTAQAKEAFDRALRLDPKDVSARYYLGLAAEQDGRKEDAARFWRELLADSPPGASWTVQVQRALARVDSSYKAPAGSEAASASAAPPTPNHDDQQIRGMVERLAQRLRQDGSDVEGWIRLVRSYTVLNDPERAEAAGNDARRALANDPDKLRHLEEGIKEIAAGLPPASAPTPPADVAAAPSQPPAAGPGNDMIRGMVQRLADRLRQDGSDVDGWLQLLRSYMVLGEADKARAAVTDARRALANDSDKLRRLDEGAKSLGVDG